MTLNIETFIIDILIYFEYLCDKNVVAHTFNPFICVYINYIIHVIHLCNQITN